ncbi:MAG: nuclear transport factor 2 family protein [Prolixibacteraceae bacterium]|nr:nuclear transport factor 2 family protein [Prolixibacteraceae bacterium]
MNLSKSEILVLFNDWLMAWNEHDLDEVMKLMHEDIVFENWTDTKIEGKNTLRRSWTPWFLNHGNFKFIQEDLFFDEDEQKMLFTWRLEWPSALKPFIGKQEIRRGADILYFIDGKISQKLTYSKTTVQIDESQIVV